MQSGLFDNLHGCIHIRKWINNLRVGQKWTHFLDSCRDTCVCAYILRQTHHMHFSCAFIFSAVPHILALTAAEVGCWMGFPISHQTSIDLSITSSQHAENVSTVHILKTYLFGVDLIIRGIWTGYISEQTVYFKFTTKITWLLETIF